jgi:ribosomal protein S18 acetylase RimI-like enzyme
MLTADPAADPAAVYAALVDWIEATPVGQLDALAPDEALISLLTARGWRYDHSAYDLLRRLDDGWVPPAPTWPARVAVDEYRPSMRDETHELIYVRAGYGDVVGHRFRDADEWERLFLTGRPEHELPVLARRDGRLVGVAVGRLFADGTGWVAQLAVDRAEQGSGIGTALMLESYARRRAEGATALGLAVSATNPHALRLYESIGLRVEREWRTYSRPPI